MAEIRKGEESMPEEETQTDTDEVTSELSQEWRLPIEVVVHTDEKVPSNEVSEREDLQFPLVHGQKGQKNCHNLASLSPRISSFILELGQDPQEIELLCRDVSPLLTSCLPSSLIQAPPRPASEFPLSFSRLF
ncbi:unnamed protein product [Caenorhabditis auriculariae]|uniref:Uncharacterized protein n=1 Tax=Caenorhabditis auriculariae TaxID=2777116 RepID=A0A8S1HYW7_9PELO|nr:unnamed protein product [Caenorhabditis auriculariae]